MKKTALLALFGLFMISQTKAQVFGLGGDTPKEFDVQMKNLTRQMVKSFSQEGKTQIAIMEFPDVNNKVTELGKLIPEELTTSLFKTGRFQVIERQLLNKVLQEQKLGMTGMLDASSAAEVGKLLGVDCIVTGTVADRGDAIRVNARMIETDNAKVFAVASVGIIRHDYLVEMLGKEITTSSSAPSSKTSAAPPTQSEPDKTKILAKSTIGNIKLDVVSATVDNSGNAKVEIVFTNRDRYDASAFIYCNRGCITYDNLGQEYGCSRVAIGQKTNVYSGLEHLFISGIPTKVTYYFSGIDRAAQSLPLLKIYTGLGDEKITTEFRKIKFTR